MHHPRKKQLITSRRFYYKIRSILTRPECIVGQIEETKVKAFSKGSQERKGGENFVIFVIANKFLV